MSEEDLDCFPFIALQNVMKAFMITHGKCNFKELSVFRSLWDLYISYHLEVEFDDGEDFEKLVKTYFSNHNVKMEDAFDDQIEKMINETVLLSDHSGIGDEIHKFENK